MRFAPIRAVLVVCFILALASACSPKDPGISLEELPPGDAAHGEALFTESVSGAPPCSDCHELDNDINIGPGLGGIGSRAGTRVDEQTAEQYIFNSIVRPSSHMVSGFSNLMYTDYADKLTPQDIADLLAYLLQL